MAIRRFVMVADQLVWFATVSFLQNRIRSTLCFSLTDRSRVACKNGNIRLRSLPGGTDNKLVQICFAGQWGQICADNWDNNDARVTCSQLEMPGNCE